MYVRIASFPLTLTSFTKLRMKAKKRSEKEKSQLEKELKRKMTEFDVTKQEVEEVGRLKDDIDLAKAVIRLIANPFLLTQSDFYILLRKMGSFWQMMMQVKSTVGQIYYKEEIADGLKRRLAELLMPTVKDQFVPKWCYEASEKRFHEVKEELENLKAASRETAA